MKAEASNGQFSETVVREDIYTMPIVWFKDNPTTVSEEYASIPPCWANNTRYDEQPTEKPLLIDINAHIVQLPPCAYGVSGAFAAQVQEFVSSFTNGNCSTYLDYSDKVDCRPALASLDSPSYRYDSENPLRNIDFWWLQNLYNSGNATFKSISAVMDNLALAITDTTTPREGEPPVWKSSILPLVYGRVSEFDDRVYGDSVKDMEQNAKKDMLAVTRGDEQWEFKLTTGDDEEVPMLPRK
ncbi:hypothetical protein GQ44DRAFT_775999 [Phaeosphaeriaceae sp. PMI808]|nr:hypothetical protein GQ44DRAFT_775999 [Phaeosphaeriaceae sp. PMI808]